MRPRPGKAVVAVGTTALAAIAVLAVSHFTRRRLVKKLLVGISRYPLDQDEKLELPLGARLQAFGEAFGEPLREGEDAAMYLHRVFDVDDAFFGERPFWRLSEGPEGP
jgi:hypothetical protein